jgi:hypothetical protein
MAEQTGILPLKGTIGNLNFFKMGDRYFARAKGGVSADRFATDPKFARSRESSSEFGTAARAGRLLRTAFGESVYANADKFVARRLTSTMISVLQTDTKGDRGRRKVIDGKMELLEGFDFNERGNLSTSFFAPYTADIDRVNGEMKIAIPAFMPNEKIIAPQSATHFRLISGGAEIDFEHGSYNSRLYSSMQLALNNVATDEIILSSSISPNSTLSLFLVLGIEFFQHVNRYNYPLKDGTFNALAIVKVSGS